MKQDAGGLPSTILRVVLTQVLATGLDGDWEQDLLMEAKPATGDDKSAFMVLMA